MMTSAVVSAVLLTLALAVPLAFYGVRAHRRKCRWRHRLARNAEIEHRLVLKGDIAGVYGRYPPPPDVFGCGVAGVWSVTARELKDSL